MARCANCGAENPDASRFCGNCGHALEAATEQQPAATEQVPPVEQPPPAAPPPAPPPAQAGTTPQQAAYEEALAAINAPAPSTDPTEPQPPATETVAEPPTAVVAPPPQQPDMFAPAGAATPPPGGSNKKVLAIVGGAIALLAIVGALVFFFFLRDDDDPEPTTATEVEAPEETEAGEVPAEEAPDEAEAGGEVLFDSIEPLIAQQAGPYTVTQSSSEPCEPPCIFPPDAHAGSVETMQVTWDAGDPTSQIYGEFLLYGTVEDAQVAVGTTAAELEATGYEPIDTFTIDGVPGTTYQSVDDEILLWSTSNIMMGLAGNKGFPTELVGYLGP